MAMGIKPGKAEINVTPMIDVLLVLLIIFMVILPSRSVGLDVRAPQSTDGQSRPLPPEDIVLTVLSGGKVRVKSVSSNQSVVDVAGLSESLHALLTQHTPGVAFVKGAEELDFAQVAEVIDVAKGAGWKRIGLLPK